MYPLFSEQPYPRNQWYMAAWSNELTDKPLGRTLLDTPLVLFRDENGKAVALDGRCPHRRYPLAQGWIDNGNIVCPYHGYAFNGSGQCVNVPGQSKPVETQKTIAYPLREMWNWIWVWMGDPALADDSLLPSLDLVHGNDPDWVFAQGGRFHLKARYMLMHDNLLDLSHLSYLHKNTIGSPGVAATKVTSKEVPWGLDIMREVRSDVVEGTPLGNVFGIKGLVDRFTAQQFSAPCLHVTGPEFRSAENGGINPGHLFGAFRAIHIIVPETPHTSHYFWGFARNFQSQNQELTKSIMLNVVVALEEDVEASQAVEAMLVIPGGPEEISSQADSAAGKGRRIMKRLIQAEEKMHKVA